MRAYLLCLCLCIGLGSSLSAQDTIPSSPRLTGRQKLIIGGLAVQQVASFYVQYHWWWEKNYHSFRFENDGLLNNYSLAVDKLGHFFTSYLYFHSLNEIMTWGGFSERTRMITATAMPFAWALSIEIGDGFSKDYGFSTADLAANCIGIGYGYLQYKVPYMRNFKFKMSYYPTAYYRDNHYKDWSLTSDYRGHFYWLSFDVHNLLPKRAQRFWPPFLNMAVGYGIDKNTYPPLSQPKDREFGIAFDWNIGSFSTRHKGLYVVKELVDYFHYPAPGVTRVQGQQAEYKLLLLR
jgi:hypothetical protein